MTAERVERLATELASRGLRATRQRIALLGLLRSTAGHPTAAELHRELQRSLPNLSLKTVYETLDAFVRHELAAFVADVGEPTRYEGRRPPHYHARCRSCGRLTDVPARADGPILRRSSLPEGFQVERVSVTLHGLCARCRPAR